MLSVHTTLEEFENGGFTMKTHQMFSDLTTPGKFKTQQSAVVFDVCLKKTRAGKSLSLGHGFQKAPFTKFFLSTRKQKKRAFSNFSLKNKNVKLPVRDGSVWTVGLAEEIKLTFQMFPA